MATDITKAHVGIQTIHGTISYPDHTARKDDPHYDVFVAARKRLEAQGLLKCVVCGTTDNIELHHSKVEFSLMNAVDITKFNEEFGLHLDDDTFALFVDSPENLEPLCLRGDSKIKLANGQTKPIEKITCNDYVLCGNGHSHKVQETMAKTYSGALVNLDGAYITPDHLVYSGLGWRKAASIILSNARFHAANVGMLGAQVFRLGGIQSQVFNSVIGSVAIDVMHNFLRVQPTANTLFHNPPMFNNNASFTIIPNSNSLISSGGVSRRTISPLSWLSIKRNETTRIGTIHRGLSPRHENYSTYPTQFFGKNSLSIAPISMETSFRTCTNSSFNCGGNNKLISTDNTKVDDSIFTSYARASSIEYTDLIGFNGIVHDISIANCHSLVLENGIIIHNCVQHHRGSQGIHVMPGPLWGLIRVVKDTSMFKYSGNTG